MKVYFIIKTMFKNKNIEEIPQTFEQNVLYFSKNYAKIVEKTKEFVDETTKFFKENTAGFTGVSTNSREQNNTISIRNAYSFKAKELFAIISITEIEMPTINETPLEKGDFVEVMPEAANDFAKHVGVNTNDIPPILRVMDKNKGILTVMIICGSKATAYTTNRMSERYTFPEAYFRRITKL